MVRFAVSMAGRSIAARSVVGLAYVCMAGRSVGARTVVSRSKDVFTLGTLARTEWVDARVTDMIYTHNSTNSDIYGFHYS